MFKPSLQLDKDAQLAWANSLLTNYELGHAVQAIEQLKHSDCEWINFGKIATECRRISAATSNEYRPFHNPSRLTMSQLRIAAAEGDEVSMQRLKGEQIKRLANDE